MKNEIQRVKNILLTIHWWNCGSKTLGFNGTVKQYIKENKIKIRCSYKPIVNEHPILTVHVSMSIGGLNVKFDCRDYECAIITAIQLNLCYLGDKSKFTFGSKSYSINYHR